MINSPFTDPSNELLETWKDWMEYKKSEFGFKFKSEQSKKASLKKLYRLSRGDNEIAIAILEEAMSNGYRGFFSLKQSQINRIRVHDPKVISMTKLEKYG